MSRTPLTQADCYVDEDVGRAESLPARAFTETEFLERELATVFARHWLLVPDCGSPGEAGEPPLAERLAVRGARLPITVAGRPLLLQRGWNDDVLRAFPNVCTHAWYPLALGPSRGPHIICGQHGRKFDCTGRFLSQVGFGEGLADFPRPCDHLRSLPLESWGPLLFVASEPPGASLAETLGPVQESVAHLPLAEWRAGRAPVSMREVEGNWKQHTWNYLDSFHVAHIHRAPGGLADAIDLADYHTELHPHGVLQWVWARRPEHGFDPALMPPRMRHPERRVFALWWFVFPNLTLNFYPWGLSINVYNPVPGQPERTEFLWLHLVGDERRYEDRDRIWLGEQVDREDIDALRQVRRALRGGGAPRGRFAPSYEAGPHWFHRRVYREVFEVR
ncbi:MAG TPA: SRPBCC family protein [Polyangia bacterium]|jgi:choline monooxygenase|nr:SRPBCC family protein [Polyangia bacterium]